MRVAMARGDGQQMQVVVAEDRRRRSTECANFTQHAERIGTAIDEVARQPKPIVGRRKRGGEKVDCAPSRFLSELAQDDVRYADRALTSEEAAQAKQAGNARLALW